MDAIKVLSVFGTRPEAVKMCPLVKALSREAHIESIVCVTGQHREMLDQVLDIFSIVPDYDLNIMKAGQTLSSITGAVIEGIGNVIDQCHPDIVLVHGDTFTTVIGAALGRLLGAEVAHIEAGLRSGSIRSPFPEELNRRIVGRLATLHFAPTERERENLEYRTRKGKAEVIVTGANTVVDALRHARNAEVEVPELPDPFGLITLHRFELVQSKSDFEAILLRLREFSKTLPLVMVVGNSERAKIEEYGLEYIFDDRLTRVDKRPYSDFLGILMRASMVVTDSGGLQEECAALGVPCAVHRERTERHQGLGENVVLTELKLDKLDEFLANWQDHRRPSTVDNYHPSVLIADRIAGYAAPQDDRRTQER